MINFPEIDLKNTDIRVLIFILSLFLFFFNRFELKTLVSIIVVFLIINYYSETKKILKEKMLLKNKNILLNYNNKIENLLNPKILKLNKNVKVKIKYADIPKNL